MLQGFNYGNSAYQNPQPLDYGDPQAEQEQKSDNFSGVTDMIQKVMQSNGIGGAGQDPSSMGAVGQEIAAGGGGGSTFLGGAGADPSSMGAVGAEIAGGGAAEGGWMSSIFGGGASGGGGGMSAAMSNPWTALAAVIIGNELYAHKKGNREKDPLKYAGDLVTGEVLNQDLEQRWLPKLGIKDGSTTSDMISTVSNPVSSIAHPKRTAKRIGKFFKKIF